MATGITYNTTTGKMNPFNTVTGKPNVVSTPTKTSSGGSSSGSSGGSSTPAPVVNSYFGTAANSTYTSSTGYTYRTDANGTPTGAPISGPTLGATTAPTNPANITPTPAPLLPDTTPNTGNIYDANGVVAGVGTANDAQIAQINADRQTAQKTNETILSKLMSLGSSDSTAQTRQDLSKQYGIQAKIAEIDSLTTDYNKIKAAKDAQIAKTQDVMGSMNFINNQTQQIERNAAPQLNELSANINSKAAILSQNQDLVNQAVQDATADKKYQMDLVTTFYQMNQDTIDRLDSDYKFALQNYLDETTNNYKQAVDTANQVMELGMTYTKAGIKSTDTLAQAYAKIQANPYTLQGSYTQAQISNIAADNARLSSETNNNKSTSGNFNDVLQSAIDKGATPEEAARAAATVSKNMGIPVNDKSLSGFLTTAKTLKKTVAPVVTTPVKAPVSAYSSGQSVRPALIGGGDTGLNGGNYQVGQTATAIGNFFSGLFGL